MCPPMVRWHYGSRTKVLLVLTPHFFGGGGVEAERLGGKASGSENPSYTLCRGSTFVLLVWDFRHIVCDRPRRHSGSSRGPPLLNRLIPFIFGGPRLTRHDPLRAKNVLDSAVDTPADARCFSRRHLARKLREPFDFLLPCWQANFCARRRLNSASP
jgi:hypothetical protein